jgi:uncharacterized protein
MSLLRFTRVSPTLQSLRGHLMVLILLSGCAVTAAAEQPAITIIIDDMGYNEALGLAAVRLPGAVTYAFLPHTPFAARLAEQAHARGKQVMLHLPMDSFDETPLGPGGLSLHMTRTDFLQTLDQSLQAVPHVTGINNHMGSLLTRHPGAMEWLMQGLRARTPMFFVDSRTTSGSVAQRLAREQGVPNTRRDVFLDNDRDPEAIRQQLALLLKKARKQGFSVGIGHPYPETLVVLKRELAELERQGIRLINASQMIALQRSHRPWQEPSSQSPKVAKNSKRSPSSICCDEPVSK